MMAGGGRRVNEEAVRVDEVGEVGEDRAGFDEAAAGVESAPNAERQDAGYAARKVSLGQVMIGAAGQAWIIHPCHTLVAARITSPGQRVRRGTCAPLLPPNRKGYQCVVAECNP